MIDNCTIFNFDGKKIRAVWNAEQEKYYFAVADILQVLTDCRNVRQYIKQIRTNDPELDSKWSSICTKIEMLSSEGKRPKIEVATIDGILCIMDSISSEKAEVVRQWLEEKNYRCVVQTTNSDLTKKKIMDVRSAFKTLVVSSLMVIVALLALIYQENSPKNRFDNTDDFTDLYIKDTNVLVEDSDVLFLNISKCKTPIKSATDSSYYLITDRSILTKFLRLAKEVNTYKYIFVDISFDKNLCQHNSDSELRMLLDSIYTDPQKVVFVRNDDLSFDEHYSNHCFYNSFKNNKYGMFVRPMLYHGTYESVAIEMIRAINGVEIEKLRHGLFCDGQIFMNNPVTKIIKPDDDFFRQIEDLEHFVSSKKEEIIDQIKNKIIIIGDFSRNDDKHRTYAGWHYGPYITYCIYKSLTKGLYKMPYKVFCFIAFWYFLISLFILGNKFLDKPSKIGKALNVFVVKLQNQSIKSVLLFLIAVGSSVLDILLKFGLIYSIFHYVCTPYLYNNFDYLFCSEFPLIYFTFIEIIVVFVTKYKEVKE